MNIIHLGLYQKEQLLDKDKKPVRFDSDAEDGSHKRGDPVMTWAEVTRARDKKDILTNIEALLEDGKVSLGRKKYIEVGQGHLDNLMTIDDLARQRCQCGGKLEAVSFYCEKCNELLCDVEESNMSPQERDQYAKDRQRCDSCGHFGFAEQDYSCDECSEPSPLNAFQVVAWIRKTGEGTSSTIMVEKVVPVTEFQFPDGSGLVQIEEDEILVDDDGDFIYQEHYEKLVKNQFDFDRVHVPPDPDYARKVMGLAEDTSFQNRGGASKYAKTEERSTPSRGKPEPTTGKDSGDEDEEENESPRRGPRRPPVVVRRR